MSLKQVYTVKMEKRVFLYNRGSEVICPQTVTTNNLRHCGDWCPMFEFTEDDDGQRKAKGYVMLHCCKRGVTVEVEE